MVGATALPGHQKSPAGAAAELAIWGSWAVGAGWWGKGDQRTPHLELNLGGQSVESALFLGVQPWHCGTGEDNCGCQGPILSSSPSELSWRALQRGFKILSQPRWQE